MPIEKSLHRSRLHIRIFPACQARLVKWHILNDFPCALDQYMCRHSELMNLFKIGVFIGIKPVAKTVDLYNGCKFAGGRLIAVDNQ